VRDVILGALDDAHPRAVLAALSAVRRLGVRSAGDRLAALLVDRPPMIQAAALAAMTQLKMPAGAARLEALLATDSNRLRLRACENVLLHEAADALKPRLRALAAGSPSAVSAAAMAALGKLDYAAVRPLLAEAAASEDPFRRRGAVWAYRYGGQGEAIVRLLKAERSPAVQLAAVRAVGDLRADAAVARLYALLASVPDRTRHLAVRDALARIASDEARRRAAAEFGAAVNDLLEVNKLFAPVENTVSPDPDLIPDQRTFRRRRMLRRNVGSLAWLLGRFAHRGALDRQIALLGDVRADSPVLIENLEALMRIGDRRATAAILDLLRRSTESAKTWLTANITGQVSIAPYNPDVIHACVAALAGLGVKEAVPVMLDLLTHSQLGVRLTAASAHVLEYLPGLTDQANRPEVAQAIAGVFQDADSYGRVCLFRACQAAGRLKVASALADLRALLNEDRPGRKLMQAAAWAIWSITGEAPPIPEPAVNQGDWIIRRLRDR
jgi:HEAT repeat protein